MEVSILKGKGNILLTGKLGDVMKESAQAGLSFVRSRAQELNVEDGFQRNRISISTFLKWAPMMAISRDHHGNALVSAPAGVSDMMWL